MIVDFNVPAFIIFLYLCDPESRKFVNVLFSRITMGSFM